ATFIDLPPSPFIARSVRMKPLLLISLFTLLLGGCLNASPESQAVTTGAVEPATTTPSTTTTAAEATPPPPPAAPAAPSVAGPKLMPVDEASGDPSLVAFRDELSAAVRRRDTDAV